jgi:uncharacterized protein YceK
LKGDQAIHWLGPLFRFRLRKICKGLQSQVSNLDPPFSWVVDTVFFPFEYQYSCNL